MAEPSLHAHTPKMAVIDPRGLPVAAVNYWATVDEPPHRRVERTTYDPAGRPRAQWDARLVEEVPNLSLLHSLSGNLLRRLSADAGTRVVLSGEAGQMIDGWDGRGTVTHVQYDSLLRPIASYECMAGEQGVRCLERWRYGGPDAARDNGAGRLQRREDTAGSRTWLGYGLGGQPLHETLRFLRGLESPDWPETEAGCDACLEDLAYATTWTYDARGAALTQRDARGHERKHRYAIDGAMSESRLAWSDGSEHVLATNLGYDPYGRIVAQTAGNGVDMRAEYDAATGNLRRLLSQRADGTVLQALSYTYDPVGNVTRIEDATAPVRYWRNTRSDGVRTYRYDTLSQLIEASGSESPGAAPGPGLPPYVHAGDDAAALLPYTQRFDYDAGGNLVELRHVGERSHTLALRVAENSNRALAWTEGDPAPDFESSFDGNGNLTTLQPGGIALKWTGRNQLQRVTTVVRTDGLDDDEIYVYDGDGQRVRKVGTRQAQDVTHTVEVRYLPGLELRTDTARGEELEVVVTEAGRASVRGLHWRAGRPSELPDDQLRYTLGDHLGSTALELDAEAALIGAEGYYPYGGTAWRSARRAIEADYRTVRYSGKERDATGLYYYGFRYYMPWLGRWLNPDPAGEVGGLNLFAMVVGNPVTYIDSDGRILTKEANQKAIELVANQIRAHAQPGTDESILALVRMTSAMTIRQSIRRITEPEVDAIWQAALLKTGWVKQENREKIDALRLLWMAEHKPFQAEAMSRTIGEEHDIEFGHSSTVLGKYNKVTGNDDAGLLDTKTKPGSARMEEFKKYITDVKAATNDLQEITSSAKVSDSIFYRGARLPKANYDKIVEGHRLHGDRAAFRAATFVAMTKNLDVAKDFADKRSKGFIKKFGNEGIAVLFEITKTKVITIGKEAGEDEFLAPYGAPYRVTDVDQSPKDYKVIRLRGAPHGDYPYVRI